MGYDIIGDVHGQADKLLALLRKMGYELRNGCWKHPDRTAIFVGDFIDRGPRGVEVVRTVQGMVEAGSAQAVMGNHELNAIAWHTPDERNPGEFLRPHHGRWGEKNRHQHEAFLAQVEANPQLHSEIVDWFMSLPLWLDLPGFRVVHACWHERFIDWLSPRLAAGGRLTQELLVDAVTEPEGPEEKDSFEPSTFKAVETLLKGIEVQLPSPHEFSDKDGIIRNRVRTAWWDTTAKTWPRIALERSVSVQLPDLPAPSKVLGATTFSKPIFFGHYWRIGTPAILHDRAVCVDYSAGNGGPLVAYRWDADAHLRSDHFVAAV